MYRIRELRLEYSLSQSQMAEYLGITQQTYSRYETGELEPSVDYLIKLANFYNISIDYLIGVSDYRNRFWNNKTLNSENANEDNLRKHDIINSPKPKRGRPKSPERECTSITPQNPLNFDVLRAFSKKFSKAITKLVQKNGIDDIIEKTGVSKSGIRDWKNGKIPNLHHLIALYKNYGCDALPLINPNGMLVKKDPIPPRGESIIAKLCADAGYKISEVAKAMNISTPVFHNRYSTTGTQARGAIELLYLFGIDAIIKYYDTE